MRRRILYSNQSNGGSTVDGSTAKTCDVVFANKITEELVITTDWSLSEFPSSTWEPIGIVVIPGEHGVLKDKNGRNQCGVMSLVHMSCDNPNTGVGRVSMCWGVNEIDIPGLKNYNKVVVTLNKFSNTATGLSSSHSAELPMKIYVDGYASYEAYGPYAPSPYIGDDHESGGYNESYGTTKFDNSSDFNALADFDGVGNTQKIIAQRGHQDYSSWKPIYNSQSDYPAASCCNMFSTIGTKQGDWYLPACGELGYILPKFADINNIISKLNNAYGIGDKLLDYDYYWTSSEFSSNEVRCINTYEGWVTRMDKDDGAYGYEFAFVSRAFLHL